MADIAFPLPKSIRIPAGRLIAASGMIAAIVLLFHILISINWSAVLSKTEDCAIHRGAFSRGFSNGFEISRRECPTPSNAMPLGMP